MKLPQFTVGDLLYSVALIGVGVAWIVQVVNGFGGNANDLSLVGMLLQWVCGGIAIGVGLFAPFRRKLIGALVGGAIQLAFVGYFLYCFSQFKG